MAADDKTIYDLVTERFPNGKDFDLLEDLYILQGYNYKAGLSSDSTDYISLTRGSSGFSVDSPPREKSPFGNSISRHRLKFHVSIPEEDHELKKRAFDLLIPIMMRYEVSFKFLRESLKTYNDPLQAGKVITIYTKDNLDKNKEAWERLIYEITSTLVQNGIPPGYRVGFNAPAKVKPERKINGSNYVTYRYESIKWPNPDPVEDIRIDVKDQQESKIYEKTNQEHGIIDSNEPKFGFGSST